MYLHGWYFDVPLSLTRGSHKSRHTEEFKRGFNADEIKKKYKKTMQRLKTGIIFSSEGCVCMAGWIFPYLSHVVAISPDHDVRELSEPGV